MPEVRVFENEGKPAVGPRGHRLIGSLLEVRKDRLSFVRHAQSNYGDAVAFRMGPKKLFLFSHPDAFQDALSSSGRFAKGPGLKEARPLLGDGLLTADDTRAGVGRRLVAPLFTADRLRDYGPQIHCAVDEAAESWAAAENVDLGEAMVRLTLDILGRTVLGCDVNADAAVLVEHLRRVEHWAIHQMTRLVPLPINAPTFRAAKTRQSIAALEQWARSVEPTGRGGLVDVLIHQDDRQLRDQLLTFLLAGHETTAASLTWALLMLGSNPSAVDRIRDEADRLLGTRPATPTDLPSLPYVQAVIDETLRLYPPVWMLPRWTPTACTVAKTAVDKRADILLCIYTLHRHPDFWPEPDQFRPERFLATDRRPGAAEAYLPFGAGARACIGGRFATQEMAICLVELIRRLDITPPAATTVRADAALTLRPDGPVPTTMVAR